MAKQNPYDAPAIPAIPSGPPADDHTEVSLRQKRGKGVLPVDDETNFGDLEAVIGSTTAQLDEALLSVDPRALASKLASTNPPEVGEPQPLPPPAPPPRRELAEDEPTLLGGPAGRLDPKELARQLAEQAKARLAAQQQEAGEPMPDDPVALAKRLAEEAKARIAAEEAKKRSSEPAPERESAPAPAPKEDPAALARRLAAEAKARLTPKPAPARDDAKPAKAKSRKAAPKAPRKPTPPPAPERKAAKKPAAKAAPKKKGSLADRAPRKKTKKNAMEALKSFTSDPEPQPDLPPAPAPEPTAEPTSEPVPEKPKAKAKSRSKAKPKRTPAPPPPRAPMGQRVPTPTPPPMRVSEVLPELVATAPSTPAPAPSRAVDPDPEPSVTVPSAPATPPQPMIPYLDVVRELLPSAIIESERPVRRPNVFTALWEAHQARAVKDGHLELAGAATMLLAVSRRLPAGQLVGIRLTVDGKGWAAFVDSGSGDLLALVPRPEIYLAGLQ